MPSIHGFSSGLLCGLFLEITPSLGKDPDSFPIAETIFGSFSIVELTRFKREDLREKKSISRVK